MENKKKKISLKSLKTFIPIYEGEKIYYGSHQRWLENEFYIKRGCGLASAANILYYMSKNIKACESLYEKEDISKEKFKEFMNELLTFIKPSFFGIPTIYSLSRGVISYAKSKGIRLKANYKPLNLESNEFIIKGLESNSPIAMLQYYRNTGHNFHWQTITGYYIDENNEEYIETSNWGRKNRYEFKNLKNNKFVYFTLK
ncbi:hypothetical protein [Senegalia sp. (in: firmicutes)]|uniref:hypothetical protein n=1 Tax=Senegalia sp. (in: firmicutes) TaxID=1924098 RepID=UPI003F9DF9AD